MNTTRSYDCVVIGAGAAGMAAACTVSEGGFSVAVLDRENHLGGILQQCIHNGFGLHHLGRELTGPEYAEEYADKLRSLPVDAYLETTAVQLQRDGDSHTVIAYSGEYGVVRLQCRAVVLAMGCRERNRGNIGTPGSRPAGIYTAGLAQRLLNIDGLLPGREAVIIGSGDIGLIMARRLTWVGCSVKAVVEILPYPSGLTRNIVQCLQDYHIPLYLNHAVTRIDGTDRVESVEVAPLQNGSPDMGQAFSLGCDTVLLSVGLIPENELSRTADVALSANTNGPVVDARLQTSVPGVFACGNVLHVHDLVDFAAQESERCGHNVVEYLRGDLGKARKAVPLSAGANLKYVVPNSCEPGRETQLLMRSLVVRTRAVLKVTQGDTVVKEQKVSHVRPAEMISLTLSDSDTGALATDTPVEVSVQ